MRLEIQCEDRIGMVREVLDLFIPHQIDMRLIEADTERRCIYCGFPDIRFTQLQILLAEIRRLDGVEGVKTVMFTPSEREHNALYTLLEALPDGVISVDLKGHITMATELAAEDLNSSVTELLHKPLQQFIKGMSFAKVTWESRQEGMSKRIKIRNKTLLLEMKPIFVSDENNVTNLAGTVIHLKSEARLDRQAASLRQAPNAENHLERYFQAEVIKSAAMARTLVQAKAFAELTMPLFIQGDVGTGKRDLVLALFQYWQKRQANNGAQLLIKHASDLTSEDVAKLDQFSGWLAIEDIEHLDSLVQINLARWLTGQPGNTTSFTSSVRLISLSSLSEQALANGVTFNKSLYFSLARLCLHVPSLAERKEDIAGLLQQSLLEMSERHRLPMPSLSKGAWLKLKLYSWPGNLKELQNICLQTLMVSKGKEWQADDIRLPDDTPIVSRDLIGDSLDTTVKQWEAELLKQLYPDYPSTRRLAKAVGMSHSAIANKLKEYGITTGVSD
ncbi:TyrR/PhhR family helix-turn-helix DNA-binding protein [Marinomonas transparens]|uniref:Transcriptional regulator n=1 Tax=Marinomonas transparens TaxID=2795388 RepID=A0A934JV19_9GAMM|nr:TyrR/PhhR family helix-turn-helix DNA-binding protein [Marinomonas transparens]MBJ7538817.1 transcriptional regulator [Marinomonas transparens]